MIRRREFIMLLGGATAAWPLAAWAQQQAMPVIGFLYPGALERNGNLVAAFRKGLAERGYIEGRNVAIEFRAAGGEIDRVPAMVADLVRRQVAVIFANGPAVIAAHAATTTIPIVFQIAPDPVQLGLIVSMSRPGGNLTGSTSLNVEVGQKRLELLHEMAPQAMVLALLVNPTNPNTEALSSDLHAAARTLGLQLQVLHASAEREIDAVFTALHQLQAGGLMIGHDPFFNSQNERLAALALRQAMPRSTTAFRMAPEAKAAPDIQTISASLQTLRPKVRLLSDAIWFLFISLHPCSGACADNPRSGVPT